MKAEAAVLFEALAEHPFVQVLVAGVRNIAIGGCEQDVIIANNAYAGEHRIGVLGLLPMLEDKAPHFGEPGPTTR